MTTTQKATKGCTRKKTDWTDGGGSIHFQDADRTLMTTTTMIMMMMTTTTTTTTTMMAMMSTHANHKTTTENVHDAHDGGGAAEAAVDAAAAQHLALDVEDALAERLRRSLRELRVAERPLRDARLAVGGHVVPGLLHGTHGA